MTHRVCGIVGLNMTSVRSIVLVMKNVLMVVQHLTMVIHAIHGSVKVIYSLVLRKMTVIDKSVIMVIKTIVNVMAVAGLLFITIRMFRGVINRRDSPLIRETIFICVHYKKIICDSDISQKLASFRNKFIHELS